MHAMPQPTEHHKKLHLLAGNWQGEERLSPSPWGPGGTALGRCTARVDLDGFFVIQDYCQEKDGRVNFRGHGVFGWDGEQQDYVWYWLDSMGSIPKAPSRGRWVGDTLTFSHPSGPAGQSRYTYRFTGADSYFFQIENSRDGGQTWQTFIETNFHRV